MPAPDDLTRSLSTRLTAAQAAERAPSISAAVFRREELVWAEAVGLADVESKREATPETQYPIASITKTFVAVSLM